MTGPGDTRGFRATSGFALRELVLIALVAGLIVLSKSLFRISIHVPGHSGLFWMALLIVARGVVRRPGAATAVGLVSGLLAVMLVPGQEGIFTWVKYVAPGLALDMMALVLPTGFHHPVQAAVMGALGNLGKLAAGYLLAVALGLPSGFIALGLGLAAVSHAAFGAAGGALGALLLGRLYRARPDLAPEGFAQRSRTPGGGGPAAVLVVVALAAAGVLAGPAGPAHAASVWTEGTTARAFSVGDLSSAVRLSPGGDEAIVPKRDVLWSYTQTGLDPRSAMLVAGGNVLVASRDGAAVLELDRAGRVVWRFDETDYRAAVGDPDAEFLPFAASRFTAGDGTPRTLISLRWGAPLIEVDSGKSIVWRYGTGVPGVRPGQLRDGYSATRLPNGNTLIADNQGCRVLEVRSSDYDPDAPDLGYDASSIVWSYGVGDERAAEHGYAEGYLDWPRTAVRLPSGNTLIADEKGARAVEVTPGGRVVWSYGTPGVYGREDGFLFEPSGAVRMPDGTTAITHGKLVGEVVFVDASGKVARRFPDPALTTPGLGMSEVRSISLTPSNSLLLTDEGNDRLLEVGVVPTAKVTSSQIDCGLPGVRKTFTSLTCAAATPPGTSKVLYYAVDGGAWSQVPPRGDLPADTVGVYLRYRVVLTTDDNSVGGQLDSVSITYAPYVGQGDPPETPEPSTGTPRTTSGTGSARRTAKRSTAVPLVPKSLGTGGAGRGAARVQVGGENPTGLVEAQGRLLGRVGSQDTDAARPGGPELGAGPIEPGGLALLGGVYLAGLAFAPTRAYVLGAVVRSRT